MSVNNEAMAIDPAGKQKASVRPQVVAAMAASMGGFVLGTGVSWTSPALLAIQGTANRSCLGQDHDCFFGEGSMLTPEEGSWIGAIFTIGALISGFVTGYLMTTIGRKWTIIAMVLPLSIGWILLTLCGGLAWSDAWIFYLARLFSGFGGGSFTLAVPIYVTEISEIRVRGSLGSCFVLFVTFGILYVNGLGALISWDILTGTLITFPILLALAMVFQPESPLYLIMKGREEDAKAALQSLRGSSFDITTEFDQLTSSYQQQESVDNIGIRQFCSKGVYLKPGLIILVLMFVQQYSGYNAVLFYLAEVFDKANVGLDPGLSATLVCIVQVGATFVALLLVEKFGRRILLVMSALLMCVSLVALGVFFYIENNQECPQLHNLPINVKASCSGGGQFSPDLVQDLGWLPLVSLMLFVFAFSIGFGPLPWVLNGELFPTEAKALATSTASAFNWLCAFFVSKFALNLDTALGTAGTYWLYAVICAAGTAFCALVVPETKGKTSDEMKQYFS